MEADDLEKICDLGHGAYGIVEKMRHRQTGTVMAVKRITATVNTQEQVFSLFDRGYLYASENHDWFVLIWKKVWIKIILINGNLLNLYP